jgi:hypothetical protein
MPARNEIFYGREFRSDPVWGCKTPCHHDAEFQRYTEIQEESGLCENALMW